MIVIEKRGRSAVTVEAPFSQDFITQLKREVRYPMRAWDTEEKVWVVKAAVFKHVHKLLDKYYPDEEWAVAKNARRLIKRTYEKDIGVDPPSKRRTSRWVPPSQSWGPWRVLYLSENAPEVVVTAAYRALAREHHPDYGGDRDEMAAINAAYEEIRQRRGF